MTSGPGGSDSETPALAVRSSSRCPPARNRARPGPGPIPRSLKPDAGPDDVRMALWMGVGQRPAFPPRFEGNLITAAHRVPSPPGRHQLSRRTRPHLVRGGDPPGVRASISAAACNVGTALLIRYSFVDRPPVFAIFTPDELAGRVSALLAGSTPDPPPVNVFPPPQ